MMKTVTGTGIHSGNGRNSFRKNNYFQVGAGRRKISPPIGSMLMGYAPARLAESVNDELTVNVLAFEYGKVRALLITVDVCVICSPQSEHFRDCVSKATGIAFQNIILAATHTHSGPAMRNTPGGAILSQEYLDDIFEPGMVEAAVDAVKNLRKAKMGIAVVNSDIGINRRFVDKSGRVWLGQNPWGCHDPVMTVISFRGVDGTPIANLIHYGAHCTAAGINPEITRDWAGPMVDRLEEQSGALSMFFNGAEGDCGPRLPNGETTGNIKLAMELGNKAGIDAVFAYKSIKDYREVDLRVLSGEIKLPYEPLPETAEIEKKIEKAGDCEKLTGLKVWEYKTLLERLEERRSSASTQTHMLLKQTVIAVGPVAFVPFPFEIFSEITLRLREHSPYQYTLSLSNANGSHLYFPPRGEISRGGYEIWVSKSIMAHPLADNADDAAVIENLRLLEQLFASSAPAGSENIEKKH
ncbi:MAG: hypothetical protein PHV59_07835 [Victivallales bacterium]|nr:hypothetical protein [Victivallales bacterium]